MGTAASRLSGTLGEMGALSARPVTFLLAAPLNPAYGSR
jgi:hypothetical protein